MFLVFVVSCDQNSFSSEHERAAVVWLASVIGNDCEVDPTKDGNIVSCRVLDSLGFESLFDENHIDYLRFWFRDDSATLNYFDSNPYLPSASSSATNNILNYYFSYEGDTMCLNYKCAYWVNGESGTFHERTTFLRLKNGLKILENRALIN